MLPLHNINLTTMYIKHLENGEALEMVCVLNDNVILLLSLNTFTSVFLNSIKSVE